jgi:hypothetical protein
MSDSNVDVTDRTRERIRAFVHSLRPLVVSGLGESDEYQRGRVLLERLADSAGDGAGNPALRFTTEECAQVCDYLRSIEPFDSRNWWDGPEHAPSNACGLQFVVGAIAESLRQSSKEPAATPPNGAGTEPHPVRDVTLARLMQRLNVVVGKLEIVTKHWSIPSNICSEDVGAAAITREVGREINRLYLGLSEWVEDRRLLPDGPYVDSFDELEEEREERGS